MAYSYTTTSSTWDYTNTSTSTYSVWDGAWSTVPTGAFKKKEVFRATAPATTMDKKTVGKLAKALKKIRALTIVI